MPGHAWILLAVLLLIPTLVVGWLRFVAGKQATALDGLGGMIFAFASFAAALWIILDKLA